MLQVSFELFGQSAGAPDPAEETAGGSGQTPRRAVPQDAESQIGPTHPSPNVASGTR